MAYSGTRFQSPLYVGDGTGEVEKNQIKTFHLMELHFNDSSQSLLNANLYFTDGFYPISYDSATAPDSGSNTYQALGKFLTFGSVVESTSIKVNTITVGISGVDVADISDIVHSNVVNKRVVIYRTFLDSNNAFQTNRTFLLFDGNIKNFTCTEAPENSVINFSVATHWANFEAKQGRTTNSNTQFFTKRYNSDETFEEDKGFEYSSIFVKDVRWGPTN